MSKIIRSGRWFDEPRDVDMERGLTVGWVADAMAFAGFGLRHPVNYRLAVLRPDPERRAYQEVVSIRVPRAIAEWWGSRKRA